MLKILDYLDDVMYYPILVVVLVLAGLYFTFKTRWLQVRMFPECFRVLMEKPAKEGAISSFQALMVSTASRVGTGNIVGVSTALCLGGYGAVFWMWLIATVGGATAFIESTLAQIYKRRDKDGDSYGGPAYYIEIALHNKGLATAFAVFLILTYAGGFNMLASYNLQSTFSVYSFYDKTITPWIIGGVLGLIVGYCLLGGGKRIVKFTEVLVPFMGVLYILMAIAVVVMNLNLIGDVLVKIFSDAFDFQKILGGIGGSCMMFGIKRGLYSNEAGVGSAPNAAASADVSHPVQQGLVQMFSVFIDTVLCTATALMCIFSGIAPAKAIAGAPYVQQASSAVFGSIGPVLITVAMVLFAFTTLIGNFFYVENCLAYLNGGVMPSKSFMNMVRVIGAIVIFIGAGLSMAAAWDIADILMGFMCLINIPSCVALGGVAIKAMENYCEQKDAGQKPVFKAADIGMDTSNLEYWK
jgi:AGCS family alanine or glycine:cation symporter